MGETTRMKRVAWALLFVCGAGVGCGSSTPPAKSGAAGASAAAGGGTGGDGGTAGGSGSGGTGSGGSGITGSGAAPGGAAAMEPPAKNPVILSFTASPANLPAGGGMVTLTWNVQQATTLSIDQNVGAVTGTSTTINIAATTIFTLTATNADGMTTATTAAVIGQNPSSMGNRYAAMIAPAQGESFAAPATLRVFAAGHDPLIDTNKPSEGLGGNASKVQFIVDEALALEVDGANAEYWVFKGFITGVAAGTHRVSARAIYTNPDLVLDSPPVLITVTTPTYDKTVTLTADLTLSGATGYELIGSAGKRVKLDGNGHSITSADGATGAFTLKFVDVYNLGERDRHVEVCRRRDDLGRHHARGFDLRLEQLVQPGHERRGVDPAQPLPVEHAPAPRPGAAQRGHRALLSGDAHHGDVDDAQDVRVQQHRRRLDPLRRTRRTGRWAATPTPPATSRSARAPASGPR